jgi:signal transduction histidine kinase
VEKMEEDLQSHIEDKPLEEPNNPRPSKDARGSKEPSISPLPSFLELINHVRKYLTQFKDLLRLSDGRFVDRRFGDYFSQSFCKALSSLDILLKEYLDYARVSNPIEKKDTVNGLIEEILERYQGLFEEKGIRLIKKFEQNLPEVTIPEDPLHFILNSLLGYALTWISPIASMGFLTQTLPLRIETSSKEGTLLKRERQDIEIIMILSGHKEPLRFSLTPVEVLALEKEGVAGFVLRLIEEIVRSNRGEFRAETDGKKAWILFSLTFPVERRKKTYYRSAEA